MDQHRSSAHNGSRKGTRIDSEGLWDWNLQSGRIHFSPRWIALIGCEEHEIGATPEEWFQRVHPDDAAQLAREIESVSTGDSTTFASRHRLRQKDGTYRWMLCRGAVVRNKAGRAIRLTGSHSDVTVETVTDPMTGLPNRLLLMDRVAYSIERSRRYKGFHFAVLVIDLGRPVNPGGRTGKSASDPLVTAVARRLETSLRIPDTMPSLRHNDLVARMDGDRFAILLDGLKEISHAKIVGERILREILEPFALSGREVRLSASIGIAISATGYSTADEVVHDAETALHRAHVLGGSHCEVFDTGILQSEQAELRLEGDFESALERGEFELFYQPIVSLASNDLLGFEALVRWRHPVLGVISPAEFLPVAEKTGFIMPLGTWILREACLRLSAWQNALPGAKDLSMSVNVSALQLSGEALVDEIASALHDSGLEPRRLTLELTEGIAMANPTAVTTLLMRIRAMGVRISVDDFGTGYSSLAYLRQFPLDALKIDRSFVRGMVTNKDTAEIVTSLIGMSRQLGLHVVAEGIEHDDQLAQLRALHCDAGQGNLFATPLDAERAAELVKAGPTLQPDRRRGVTTPPHSEDRVPPIWIRGSRFIGSHRRAVVVAGAAAVVLFAAGFMRVVGEPAPPALVSSSTPAASAETAPPTAPSLPPASLPASVAPLPRATVASPRSTTPPALPAPASLEVVHLHRLGSCHGRLEVTRDGVTFAGQEGAADERLTLNYLEFLHALEGDTLILKSATKTYRFKADESHGRTRVQLRGLADRIARARR
jgi:diguanylate cyclase (GGDEF)-like protein/PAS domain S-box-containing protein